VSRPGARSLWNAWDSRSVNDSNTRGEVYVPQD
jgi:hypothetical protein